MFLFFTRERQIGRLRIVRCRQTAQHATDSGQRLPKTRLKQASYTVARLFIIVFVHFTDTDHQAIPNAKMSPENWPGCLFPLGCFGRVEFELSLIKIRIKNDEYCCILIYLPSHKTKTILQTTVTYIEKTATLYKICASWKKKSD